MANPVCEVLLTQNRLKLPADPPDLSAGAIVEFRGVVRELEAGREISGIEYETHWSMAQYQLTKIGNEAAAKFGLRQIIIHHRIGFVPAGEPSLLLRVVAGHRAEGFEASRWTVDELKKRVPIWKHPKFRTDNEMTRTGAAIEEHFV